MNTLALTQNKRLILAGLLAFIILLASQISVRAYEFIGNVRTVYTIGTASGYPVLTIGSAGSGNSALNIGEMPSVVTDNPTVTKTSETSYDFLLVGTISSMGNASSATYGFNWGYSPALGNVVGVGTASNIGSFSVDIGDVLAGRTVYYRFYVIVDSTTNNGAIVNAAGAITPTVATSSLLPLFVVILGILTIFVGLAVSMKTVTFNETSGIIGLVVVFLVIILTVVFLVATNSIVTTP